MFGKNLFLSLGLTVLLLVTSGTVTVAATVAGVTETPTFIRKTNVHQGSYTFTISPEATTEEQLTVSWSCSFSEGSSGGYLQISNGKTKNVYCKTTTSGKFIATPGTTYNVSGYGGRGPHSSDAYVSFSVHFPGTKEGVFNYTSPYAAPKYVPINHNFSWSESNSFELPKDMLDEYVKVNFKSVAKLEEHGGRVSIVEKDVSTGKVLRSFFLQICLEHIQIRFGQNLE